MKWCLRTTLTFRTNPLLSARRVILVQVWRGGMLRYGSLASNFILSCDTWNTRSCETFTFVLFICSKRFILVAGRRGHGTRSGNSPWMRCLSVSGHRTHVARMCSHLGAGNTRSRFTKLKESHLCTWRTHTHTRAHNYLSFESYQGPWR